MEVSEAEVIVRKLSDRVREAIAVLVEDIEFYDGCDSSLDAIRSLVYKLRGIEKWNFEVLADNIEWDRINAQKEAEQDAVNKRHWDATDECMRLRREESRRKKETRDA